MPSNTRDYLRDCQDGFVSYEDFITACSTLNYRAASRSGCMPFEILGEVRAILIDNSSSASTLIGLLLCYIPRTYFDCPQEECRYLVISNKTPNDDVVHGSGLAMHSHDGDDLTEDIETHDAVCLQLQDPVWI